MGFILFFIAAAHIFYTPFTKVEESFNIQAIHDILYLKENFTHYDHYEFPGVVPRTFVGPLILSILSSPIVTLIEALHIPKFFSQYIVRLLLAAIVTYSWQQLNNSIRRILGVDVSVWFTIITISQFHFIFYMSRTLPNIFALPIVLLAISAWLNNNKSKFIWLAGFAILVFRSELLLFFGLLAFYDIASGKVHFSKFLTTSILAGVSILAITIGIDSFFWKRLVWPEGEVLWYNTVLNKSSNWGTSPFLWYFYSAIPRAMGLTTLFAAFGIYMDRRIRPLCMTSILFVFIYSILPHKELRFIIYVFPVLNISAACACNNFWINRSKSTIRKCIAVFTACHILANFCLTSFLLLVSSTNYPGGQAIMKLHSIEHSNVNVHISNLVAQSGFTRFLQVRSDWVYNKTENLNYGDPSTLNFDYLLVEQKLKASSDWKFLQQYFDVTQRVDCFSNIGIQYKSLIPIKIKTKPCILLLKRNGNKLIESVEELGGDDDDDAVVKNISEELINSNASKSQATPEVVKQNLPKTDTIVQSDELIDEEQPKKIDYESLRKLALGSLNVKEVKNTRAQIRKIIEEHYKSKGSEIENVQPDNQPKDKSRRPLVRTIIKQEKIKDMIETISKLDLTKYCDLDKLSTKDCLKSVIDKIDQ